MRAGSGHTGNDTVLVLDFGAQYAQLIARRVRECHVYSEIVPWDLPVEDLLARRPSALILSGGPRSVYSPGAPRVDPALFETGLPILGICYGHQVMAQALDGVVDRTGTAEYGATRLRVSEPGVLFDGLPIDQQVWMSHGDSVSQAPPGFLVTASTPSTPVAAFEDRQRRLYGVQFHPEVLHSERGLDVLRHFLLAGAGCRPTWTMVNIVDEAVAAVRAQVGSGRLICGLSGGVDSAVAAALVHRAVGDALTCVFVDHGLLREGEAEQVEREFVASTGVELVHVKAADRFAGALAGVSEPEQKRKIIGREFIRVFEEAARELEARAEAEGATIDHLVQGTLYPDVIESGSATAAKIKSHHNVGGLPDDLQFGLIEPLRSLFKDEVRRLGEELGLPEEIVWRQPFPGPGLAVRIIGEVTPERLDVVRAADAVVRDEIRRAGLDREIWQVFAVLLADVRSVGVQGDERTYGHPIVLRAVTSEDAMTADWARLPYNLLERISNRIVNEVPQVNRVVYDITSKPPGTIEWE
ncbi:glutamine-hydrolyzing GMP synthase [Candidatus Frankia nodulisporulans]|uniref:glutamine-hydrolyzing GMP synthase n=1 Tax=Candidatus Frankia nodulisporulans TaxID=2060052 RepID=UPI0013D060BC|nr:glutamine-hydrolyzing GMP synthase [Candidatus Frankia nodulisporulans]